MTWPRIQPTEITTEINLNALISSQLRPAVADAMTYGVKKERDLTVWTKEHIDQFTTLTGAQQLVGQICTTFGMKEASRLLVMPAVEFLATNFLMLAGLSSVPFLPVLLSSVGVACGTTSLMMGFNGLVSLVKGDEGINWGQQFENALCYSIPSSLVNFGSTAVLKNLFGSLTTDLIAELPQAVTTLLLRPFVEANGQENGQLDLDHLFMELGDGVFNTLLGAGTDKISRHISQHISLPQTAALALALSSHDSHPSEPPHYNPVGEMAGVVVGAGMWKRRKGGVLASSSAEFQSCVTTAHRHGINIEVYWGCGKTEDQVLKRARASKNLIVGFDPQLTAHDFDIPHNVVLLRGTGQEALGSIEGMIHTIQVIAPENTEQFLNHIIKTAQQLRTDELDHSFKQLDVTHIARQLLKNGLVLDNPRLVARALKYNAETVADLLPRLNWALTLSADDMRLCHRALKEGGVLEVYTADSKAKFDLLDSLKVIFGVTNVEVEEIAFNKAPLSDDFEKGDVIHRIRATKNTLESLDLHRKNNHGNEVSYVGELRGLLAQQGVKVDGLYNMPLLNRGFFKLKILEMHRRFPQVSLSQYLRHVIASYNCICLEIGAVDHVIYRERHEEKFLLNTILNLANHVAESDPEFSREMCRIVEQHSEIADHGSLNGPRYILKPTSSNVPVPEVYYGGD